MFFRDYKHELLEHQSKIDILNTQLLRTKSSYDKLKYENERILALILKHQGKSFKIKRTSKNKNVLLVINEKASGEKVFLEVLVYDVNQISSLYHNLALYASYKINTSELEIEDIVCSQSNMGFGYGQVAVNEILEQAETKNISLVWGKLEEDQWENLEHIQHFFKKIGFDIFIDENVRVAKMEKKL